MELKNLDKIVNFVKGVDLFFPEVKFTADLQTRGITAQLETNLKRMLKQRGGNALCKKAQIHMALTQQF